MKILSKVEFCFCCVARNRVVGAQLLFRLCMRCLFCCEIVKRLLWGECVNEEKRARFGRSLRCRFSCTGLNRFAILTIGDRQARSLASCRLCVSEPKRRRCRARARAEAMAVFLFLCGARCCALVWWRAVDGVCALLRAVCAARCCVRGWVLCVRLDAVCATRRCVCSSHFTQYFFCITARHG